MRDRLSIKASMLLPETLADCYSLSHFDQKLKGILLSKFGIFQRAHDDKTNKNDKMHTHKFTTNNFKHFSKNNKIIHIYCMKYKTSAS